MTISIFIVWLLSVYTIGVLSGIAFCCLSKWLKSVKKKRRLNVITIDEAIFCEKSYTGETSCTDCKYYRTNTCKYRETHKLAINALELTKVSLNKKCEDDKNSGFKMLIEDKETYKKVIKQMNKADLKDWMIVEDNLERRYIVDKIHSCFLGYTLSNDSIYDMDDYDDDLCDSTNGHYITKVFDPTPSDLSWILGGGSDVILRNTIWEREEPAIEMTISEIEEKLGIKNLKIVEEKKDDQ